MQGQRARCRHAAVVLFALGISTFRSSDFYDPLRKLLPLLQLASLRQHIFRLIYVFSASSPTLGFLGCRTSQLRQHRASSATARTEDGCRSHLLDGVLTLHTLDHMVL